MFRNRQINVRATAPIIVVLAVLGIVLFAACGSSDEPEQPVATDTPTAQAATIWVRMAAMIWPKENLRYP